jgi:parallel beta-helix repeat protein
MRHASKLAPAFFVLFLCGATEPANAAAFTVDTDDGAGPDIDPGDGNCQTDAGTCSLLAALMESNALPGPNTIGFGIGGGGSVATIMPSQPLPLVTTALTIDGTTQACAPAGPCVELVGTLVPESTALDITRGDSTVRGLAIGSFTIGIRLRSNGGNRIQGNYIGTDATGTVPRGNATGISVRSGAGSNLIGGPGPGDGNRIAANEDGIFFLGNSPANQVLGNVIGGDTAIPPELFNEVGIMFNATSGQTIGAPGAGNVISGNGIGVYIAGSNVTDIVVQANCIGPIDGCTVPFGNTSRGVLIFSSPGNTIGGSAPGEGNVISSNGAGVVLSLEFATDNQVLGNFIGTDPTGSLLLGNDETGVSISSSASDNRIGGVEPGAGNAIMNNGLRGVFVFGGSGNEIRRNSISGNGELGIDLGPSGVTPNDPGDSDSGPNNLQNFPVLTAASASSSETSVEGWLDSTPSSAFEVEFFSSEACDPAGHGEGTSFLGTAEVTTDSSGVAVFSATFPVVADQVVTATATGPDGSTSEFSLCRTVVFEPAVGACCLSSGECTLTSEAECPGIYQGDGTVCEPGVCEGGPVPAVSHWGSILTVLLLLAAGPACLRPRRSRE